MTRISPVRLGLVALAFGVLLVACGGGDTAVDPAPDVVTQVTPDPDTEGSVSEPPADPSTDQTVAGPVAAEPEESESAAFDRLNGPFSDSGFPDVVVEDLAGGQVNVKYLGAEDKPVLLWFWAPH